MTDRRYIVTDLDYARFFRSGFETTAGMEAELAGALEPHLFKSGLFGLGAPVGIYGAAASGQLAAAALNRLGIPTAAFIDQYAKGPVQSVDVHRPEVLKEMVWEISFLVIAVSPARQLSVLREIHDRVPADFPVVWLWANEYFDPHDYEVLEREIDVELPQARPGVDPRGQLVFEGEEVFRVIRAEERAFYRDFLKSQIFEELNVNWIIHTEIVDRPDLGPLVVRHAALPPQMPCDWSPMMFKRAAIHFTRFWARIERAGLSLQDAHDGNVMFRVRPVSRPTVTDLTSIGPRRARVITRPLLEEYLESWIYPMMLFDAGKSVMARGIRQTRRITSTDIRQLLPMDEMRTFFEQSCDLVAKGGVPLSDFLCFAEEYLQSAHPKSEGLGWNETDYQPELWFPVPMVEKETLLLEILEGVAPFESVLDLGANRGRMSLVALRAGAREVVAIDTAERLMDDLAYFAWHSPVLPLVRDASTVRRETEGLVKRYDVVLALALLHHLVNTQSVKMAPYLRELAKISRKALVLEWVAPHESEPLFQTWPAKPEYDLETARQVLAGEFTQVKSVRISETRQLLVATR